jgi:signal transduction histidine kinase
MKVNTAPRFRILKQISVRYGLAILAVALGLLAAWPLDPLQSNQTPFLVLLCAIVFSALFCGIGPSMVALVLSLAGIRYWFLTPARTLSFHANSGLLDVLTFIFVTAVILLMAERHRRTIQNLRNAQSALGVRVKERTDELNTANGTLRQLTARLLHLQDDERRRFARELHDSVGQSLAALGMNLSLVRGDIDRMIKTANTLSDSEALVHEMSKEIRTISHLLHPPLLDEAGLRSALLWYVEGFAQRSNIQVDLHIPDDFGRLPREIETAVFRIVQECLTNVHRHSGSPVAKIRVARFSDEVLVEVADSGKGISKEKQQELATSGTPGVGIAGMRERIRQLGGTLELSSADRGTVVVVRLPISTASMAAA